MAHFDDGELVTQSWLVSGQVSDDQAEQIAAFGLILALLTFGTEFTEAMEVK